ncbi:MAG: NAD(P)-dependent glycerol-1-phosphate dehydrogenase [Candidatus Thermoplasmatota archaeon]|nr:NAD(P)-dependent glycerol-1-phosphate dehydrogenase [Candidatus Thermoplasmatota archaeon]
MPGEPGQGFDKSRSMELPRIVVIGHRAVEETGRVSRRLHLRSPALIVEDPITRKVAGNRVGQALQEEGIEVDHHIIEEASLREVDVVGTLLEDRGFTAVLGVGGGRPIDVAKYASFQQGIPFLSLPTAASHDGLVSANASLLGPKGKTSLAAHVPLAVIMDTEIIAASPHRLLASGCADVISNVTAVKDWKLANRLRNEAVSSSAATLSEMTARMIIEGAPSIKPGLEESAWNVCKALVSSGVAMSIAGSSRPASGSEHLFSHALDRLAGEPALHGEQVGLGTIMMMFLHGGNWEEIRDALELIGAPITADAVGLSSKEITAALIHAHEVKPDRYTILGDKGLSPEAAKRVATLTGVI